MSSTNKMVGLIAVIILAIFAIQIYMGGYLNANTSAWNPILVNEFGTWIPLIFGAGLLIFVVYNSFVKGK